MEYRAQIDGREVWVTVLKPMFKRDNPPGYEESSKWCCAFKFTDPGLTDGEYVRSEGGDDKLMWFDSADEAADAAFERARMKIRGGR